jgi:hypothetical protein
MQSYEAQPSDSGVAHSRAKLDDDGLHPSFFTTQLRCSTEMETCNYRCSCWGISTADRQASLKGSVDSEEVHVSQNDYVAVDVG